MIVFPYILKVSLLLAVLTLAYRWLIQYETFSKVNRVLLWFNVVAAWTLPLIPLASWGPIEVQREFHQTLPTITQAIPTVSRAVSSPIFAPTLLPSEVVTAWGVAEWLLLLYGFGVTCMAFRFLFRLFRLVRVLLKRPIQRLENGLILVQDEDTASPYSFFRWIILNPARHTLPEAQQILAHETEHARQGHSFDLLLAEIQRIALWFNPFAWIHQQLVQGNLEYLADEAVLTHGFAKKSYQITLLRVVLRTNEPPLTNSFAQSLLKKRIKMMNRKPSRRLVWGKYALLLATLYVSAAFVAPYKNQIVEMSPAPLQPVVRALAQETAPLPEKSAVDVSTPAPKRELADSVKLKKVLADDVAKKVKSKWAMIKGDTLYWAIPPTATWDEINLLKADIKNFGAEMNINVLKYDPMQQFITSIAVYIKHGGSSGSGDRDGEDNYSPMKGFSGFIWELGKEKGLGMGQSPPEPLLSRYNQSYQEALALKKANKNEYLADKLMKELTKKAGGMGGTSYSQKSFEGKYSDKSFERYGVGKSPDNTLMLGESNKDAEFYLNAEPATFEELNGISIDKIDKVEVRDASKTKKRYIMVYTN